MISSTETTGRVHNMLDFESHILDAATHIAAEHASLNNLADDLEDAAKIITGLGTLCKLARNNQDTTNEASEENPPLSAVTMEALLSLGEVAAKRFILEIDESFKVSDFETISEQT